MENDRLETLLEVMPDIATAVNSFNSHEVQREAFDALMQAALGASSGEPEDSSTSVGSVDGGAESSPPKTKENSSGATGQTAGTKSKKKKVASISVDQNLDIRPSDKTSLLDFATEKDPKSMKEKSMVIVYWLQEISVHESIGVSQIYTCYKGLKWRAPTDLKNHLQTLSATEKWLDTSDSHNISLTTLGSNFVEFDLPKLEKT